jgi:DNA polymerase/3'-5' exonuclease PolX
MSATATKRSLQEAQNDAIIFRMIFEGCFERWEIAGSVRRRKSEVGDVEHVVIPRVGEVDGDNIFGASVTANLLWHRLDQLVAAGKLTKHVYDAWEDDITGQKRMSHRWGEKYRGVDFRGFNHEIFCADADNFGCIYAIRTGSADFSRQLVDRMRINGLYRQQGGYVVHVRSGTRVPCPNEETFFKLCGREFVPADRRI